MKKNLYLDSEVQSLTDSALATIKAMLSGLPFNLGLVGHQPAWFNGEKDLGQVVNFYSDFDAVQMGNKFITSGLTINFKTFDDLYAELDEGNLRAETLKEDWKYGVMFNQDAIQLMTQLLVYPGKPVEKGEPLLALKGSPEVKYDTRISFTVMGRYGYYFSGVLASEFENYDAVLLHYDEDEERVLAVSEEHTHVPQFTNVKVEAATPIEFIGVLAYDKVSLRSLIHTNMKLDKEPSSLMSTLAKLAHQSIVEDLK